MISIKERFDLFWNSFDTDVRGYRYGEFLAFIKEELNKLSDEVENEGLEIESKLEGNGFTSGMRRAATIIRTQADLI